MNVELSLTPKDDHVAASVDSLMNQKITTAGRFNVSVPWLRLKRTSSINSLYNYSFNLVFYSLSSTDFVVVHEMALLY